MSVIRIVLADDHEVFREGFRTLVNKEEGIELVGEAENGATLLSLVKIAKPHVIITDIQMPGMDGIEATKALKLLQEPAGIIAFSNYDEDSYIVDILEAGASGYLLKNTKKKEIFEAIRLVAAGGKYYCNSTSIKLARMIANSKAELDAIKFTSREMEIITHICNELSNKEIADAMCLSVRTIEGYRDSVLEKTGARNAVGLVIYAIRKGLFQVEEKK